MSCSGRAGRREGTTEEGGTDGSSMGWFAYGVSQVLFTGNLEQNLRVFFPEYLEYYVPLTK